MTQARDPDLSELRRLLDVVRRLRAPDGCPWDREQTLASMAPHLVEEAFEASAAIRAGDDRDVREELGDVLMNVLMLARIAEDEHRFDLEGVARAIADKLVRRHPHVFGDTDVGGDAGRVLAYWEAIKRREQAERAAADGAADVPSALDGVPAALPALQRAQRVGEKAARVGFDWPDRSGPRRKLAEEIAELDEALAGDDPERVSAELGDVLFSLVNLARHHGVHAETALQQTVDRFGRRFRAVEAELGDRVGEAGLDELEASWSRAKRAESDGD